MTDIPELERRLAEANAKVAAQSAAWVEAQPGPYSHTQAAFDQLKDAVKERAAALAALEEARRPKLLSPEEAEEIWDKYADGTEISEVIGPILTAAHKRAYAVIVAALKAEGWVDDVPAIVKRALGLS